MPPTVLTDQEWDHLREVSDKITEFVDFRDVPGNDPTAIAELKALIDQIRDKEMAPDKCSSIITNAQQFFSHGKWRSRGAKSVHDSMRENAASISVHIQMRRSLARDGSASD